MPGQVLVTQAQYETIALAQVKELWTAYGNLTEIWLDGGCGAMCDRVGQLVRATNAVGAVAFNGGGESSLRAHAHACNCAGGEKGQPPPGDVVRACVRACVRA